MESERWATESPDELLQQIQEALHDEANPLLADPERLRPLIPHLIPLLPRITPPWMRYSALHAIGDTSPSSIPDLLQVAKDESCTYRFCNAGEYLALIGEAAIPALIEGLCDADARIRNLAGRALRTMHPAPSLSARALLDPLAPFAPPVWPGKPLRIQPGDLARFFTPRGVQDAVHPFRDAPTFEGRGGLLYLGSQPSPDTFQTVLRLLYIQAEKTDYAVFIDQAEDPLEERYLVQLRLISVWSLKRLFSLYPDENTMPLVHQERTIGALLWAFIGHQQGYWGTFFADPRAPSGAFGGDDEYAREELAFGIMVETPGVYRIWSRAWLVEK